MTQRYGPPHVEKRRLVAVTFVPSIFNSSKCPIGPVEFDATGYVQRRAQKGESVTTLGLRAKDEGDTRSWKRFDKGTASLSITYNSYPNAPDQMAVDSKKCNSGIVENRSVGFRAALSSDLSGC